MGKDLPLLKTLGPRTSFPTTSLLLTQVRLPFWVTPFDEVSTFPEILSVRAGVGMQVGSDSNTPVPASLAPTAALGGSTGPCDMEKSEVPRPRPVHSQ